MTERYDVLTARESNGKSYFTKLGAMFPNRSGDGFTIMLDAIPASLDGQYRLIIKKPQERSEDRHTPQRSQSQGGQRGGSFGRDDDDYVPGFDR